MAVGAVGTKRSTISINITCTRPRATRSSIWSQWTVLIADHSAGGNDLWLLPSFYANFPAYFGMQD